ncbi:F-box/kelch-repeat protein [Senna tora]|uniref:F-box/kelch-repeat protein n=1 Tax=Senna tora TaxID=362788 RepID=A0A834SFE6_9FABA|nr:F-box/kelch-repeat protein [Senna tora]
MGSKSFYFWNPLFNKYVRHTPKHFSFDFSTCLGFGYDSRTNHFKLLQVNSFVAKLYTISSIGNANRWRIYKIAPPQIHGSLDDKFSSAYVNERLHCDVPFTIWAMKDYGEEKSWIPLHEIRLHSSPKAFRFQVVGWKNEGKLWGFKDTSRPRLHVFDHKTKTFCKGKKFPHYSVFRATYTESLAFMDVEDEKGCSFPRGARWQRHVVDATWQEQDDTRTMNLEEERPNDDNEEGENECMNESSG